MPVLEHVLRVRSEFEMLLESLLADTERVNCMTRETMSALSILR